MSKDITDMIDYGQGYDDTITELFKYFNDFRNGFYGLINYGDDDWWENFNQGCGFNEKMEEEWKAIDIDEVMDMLENMGRLMAGSYLKFDKFTEGVIQAYGEGYGLRHRESDVMGRKTLSDSREGAGVDDRTPDNN